MTHRRAFRSGEIIALPFAEQRRAGIHGARREEARARVRATWNTYQRTRDPDDYELHVRAQAAFLEACHHPAQPTGGARS